MILIRADANEQIGTGHIMRCISIARALQAKGESVKFVTADHKADRLLEGFRTHCLESDWTQMEFELPTLFDALRQEKPSMLLVDGYFVTEAYFHALKSMVPVAYLDDLNQSCWDVDYLINYNIFAESYDYSAYKEKRTQLLLGTRYAPLRDEFRNCPTHEMKDVKDILVSAGGADPELITEKVLKGICRALPEVRFHFIVGALNPRIESIQSLAAQTENAILHINERHMSELMKSCDLAISAAGSTLYELCACGTPTITYTLADNQLAAAEQFEKQGIMLNAGDCRKDAAFIDRMEALVEHLTREKELRSELSGKMQRLVDGNGAARLAGELLCR